MCFTFDKKQFDSLSSITDSNFVSALNGEKRNIDHSIIRLNGI